MQVLVHVSGFHVGYRFFEPQPLLARHVCAFRAVGARGLPSPLTEPANEIVAHVWPQVGHWAPRRKGGHGQWGPWRL